MAQLKDSLILSLTLATGSTGAISRSQLSVAVRDAIDGASMASGSMASIGGSSSVYQSFKEPTVSISSVNEEEDESASLISDRCRYISVSEEDELLAVTATTTTATTITASTTTTITEAAIATTSAAALAAAAAAAATATQAQSVITEQPTASRKLKLDLLLASADIITQPLTQQQIREEEEVEEAGDEKKAGKSREQPEEAELVKQTKSDDAARVASETQNPEIESTNQPLNIYVTTTTATPDGAGAVGKTISEDSDEYRSLEGRDESDYPISE